MEKCKNYFDQKPISNHQRIERIVKKPIKISDKKMNLIFSTNSILFSVNMLIIFYSKE